MTTPAEGDVYNTGSKQILVTRDPVYVHPAISKHGNYIGRQPHDYLPLAIFVTVINPLLGPIAILFAGCLISYVVHALISNGDGWWFEFSGRHPGHPAVKMVMSSRAFHDGDINYAVKWSNYAFLTGMIVIVASCVMYIAIAFAVSGPELRGGHSY